MRNIPCKDCLVLPICKNRAMGGVTGLALNAECIPLLSYLTSNLEDGEPFETRGNRVRSFFGLSYAVMAGKHRLLGELEYLERVNNESAM